MSPDDMTSRRPTRRAPPLVDDEADGRRRRRSSARPTPSWARSTSQASSARPAASGAGCCSAAGLHHRRADPAVLDRLRHPRRPDHAVRPAQRLRHAEPQRRAPAHLFGTDQLGRDVLSRVMAGARDVLIVAPIAAVLSVAVGHLARAADGLLPGLGRRGPQPARRGVAVDPGRADRPARRDHARVVAAPSSSLTSPSLFTPIVARTVRAAVLAEAQLDYVTSARLRGESGAVRDDPRDPAQRHAAPILVELTVRIGYAVFTVATLSFLGAGIQPPSPDWGLTISDDVPAHPVRSVVADVVPGAGDRQRRHRHQPGRRLDRGGDGVMSR